MYGYVRPLKGELKVREYEGFKAMYCGLCHRLKERCGFAARFVVNFDFTFLAMLLSEAKCANPIYRRCAASPFRKKCCHCADPALDAAADYSVILAYWKLKDSIRDDGFWKRMRSRVCTLLLHRAYKKAAANAPEFDRRTWENLEDLGALEAEGSPSLDAVADKFAGILTEAAAQVEDRARQRILRQIFYHTGRIVYILDAADDLPEDLAAGGYNPLARRFNLTSGDMPEEVRHSVELTLALSQNLLRSAFELLPEGPWTGVLTNIIYEGLPWVAGLVLKGKWREIRKIHKEKMNGAEI